jgi:hypothetical protein
MAMADDDLRGSLRSEDDDSLFGDFTAPEELGFGEPERAGFGDPLSMGYDEPEERRPRRRSTGFLGLTAQQRMILSFFLFLDVSLLGCLCLIAIGAIQPPFMR